MELLNRSPFNTLKYFCRIIIFSLVLDPCKRKKHLNRMSLLLVLLLEYSSWKVGIWCEERTVWWMKPFQTFITHFVVWIWTPFLIPKDYRNRYLYFTDEQKEHNVMLSSAKTYCKFWKKKDIIKFSLLCSVWLLWLDFEFES